jgi:hypothetical protein
MRIMHLNFFLLLLLWLSIPGLLMAQRMDSTLSRPPVIQNKFLHNIFQDAINSVWKNPNDSLLEDASILHARSEKSFELYKDYIIRKIAIQHYGFEVNFSDTTNRVNYLGTKILNTLHTDTREEVIRHNLFIRENTKLNPYKIADNERFLRTIEYIQDARIIVIPIPETDSVDLVVITKDLFSLTGSVEALTFRKAQFGIAEANFMGLGQRIELNSIWQSSRKPKTGFDVGYKVQNIAGTFFRSSIRYSTMAQGITEEENAFIVQIDRPLVSPYSKMAGGMEFRLASSINAHQKPDSVFQRYQYNSVDGWVAYNIRFGNDSEFPLFTNDRNRFFISFRYKQQNFMQTPDQPAYFNHPTYLRSRLALAAITFFRQDFYKMNYLYGFGTTEDVPYGYSATLTGGWHKLAFTDRPYIGLNLFRYFITSGHGFMQLTLRSGSYIQEGKLTDAGLMVASDWYSPLLSPWGMTLREHIKLNISGLINRTAIDPLKLNNELGIEMLHTDSLYGNFRLSGYAESILYTRYKLWGFRIAPFAYVAGSLLVPEQASVLKSDFFTNIGGGIRIRNENLVLGTIELRAGYLPRTAWGVKSFDYSIRSNIRFRYQTEFIKAPEVAAYNSEY